MVGEGFHCLMKSRAPGSLHRLQMMSPGPLCLHLLPGPPPTQPVLTCCSPSSLSQESTSPDGLGASLSRCPRATRLSLNYLLCLKGWPSLGPALTPAREAGGRRSLKHKLREWRRGSYRRGNGCCAGKRFPGCPLLPWRGAKVHSAKLFLARSLEPNKHASILSLTTL